MAKVKERFMKEGKVKDITAEFSAISLVTGAALGLIGYHYILRPTFPSLPALGTTKKEVTLLNKMSEENSILRRTTNQLMQKVADLTAAKPTQPAPVVMQRKLSATDFGMIGDEKPVDMYGMIGGVKMYRAGIPNPIRTLNPGNPDLPDAEARERMRHYGAMNKVMNSNERAERFGLMGGKTASSNLARMAGFL